MIEAIKERVPEAEHRLCSKHILANLNKRHNGEGFIKPFWKAVKGTIEAHFKEGMEQIKSLDIRSFNYLMSHYPSYWSRAYYRFGDCDAV